MPGPLATEGGLLPLGADETRFALIERGEVWNLAAGVLGSARAGSGSVLLVEGASGLGKSPLVAAVNALALESGMQVLNARGRRREREFRYGVLIQLVESAVEDAKYAAADASAANGDSESGQQPMGIPAFDDLRGLYRMCLNVARAAPVVLLVDDVDLADEPSLLGLLYLAERIRSSPVALVLSACTAGVAESPLLRDIARQPATTRYRLDPLSFSGTWRRLAKRWPAVVADESAAEIHRASRGNPFVIDVLAGVLAERGDGAFVSFEENAPQTLADWAMTRADDVDPRARDLLSGVAVLGDGSELRHVSALAEVDVGAAAAILDRLVDVDILTNGGAISFAQPAVCAAIRSAQPFGGRAESNLRAARLLAAEDVDPERVARHLLHATRAGSGWTVDALRDAAAVALSRAAPAEAAGYLRRALEEPPESGQRAHVVLELGRAQAAAGDPEAGQHLSAALREPHRAISEPLAALEAGRTLVALGKPVEALRAFEHGLKDERHTDSALAARLRAGQTLAHWLITIAQGQTPALPPVPETEATAGDRSLLALHAVEAAIRGLPATEVRALAERGLGRGALLKDETSGGLAYYCVAAALAFAGDLQTAEAALTAAIDDAQSRGSVLGFALASRLRARTILMRGRLTDAAADARHALAVEHRDWQMGRGGARAILAAVMFEQGHLEGARRYLDQAAAVAGPADPLRILLLVDLGRLEFACGDATTALRHFLRVGEIAEGARATNPAILAWRGYAGLAMAATGDPDEGKRLIQTELSQAEAFGAPGPVGRAMRALASVSDPAAAIETLEAAVEVLRPSQAALERAGAMVDFGAALRRSGKRRDALPILREGLDLAQRCGADALVNRAMHEAAAAGARPRRTALRGREALTQRERHVASLAAEGYSNREIADKLVVTVKTVEWHLGHAFTKLGVKSRRDLAGQLD